MKIFGILAYPVHHSLSPQMHNAGIIEEGIDALYTRFEVRPEHLEEFFQKNFSRNIQESSKISGLSVSVPHKETCQKFLDEIDEAGKKVGAVNTIYWKEKNILCGTNTDYLGFLKSLEEKYELKNLGKKTVLVLGAGGATKAILYALETLNPLPKKVILWNRTVEKAEKLAKSFAVELFSGTVEELEHISKNIDLVINTTSLGMEGDFENISPLTSLFWKPHHTAFDIVYTPLETKFLQECREAGGTGISGEKMFLFQGIAQFEIFHGSLEQQKNISEKTKKIMSLAIQSSSQSVFEFEKNWTVPKISEPEKKDILGTIVAHKQTEIFASLEFFEQKLAMGEFLFSKKLREKKSTPHLIAEIKPASPSKGKVFREGDSVEKIAKMYQENGVSCISVLTDKKFFGGHIQNLKRVRSIVGRNFPLLRKDFIVHPAQIFEARYFGADAVLLMKSVLSTEKIEQFLQICTKLGMDALVEVHTAEELAEVLTKTSAEIIGINSRDLKTLQIDPQNFQNILAFGKKHFPEKMKEKIFISESGISSYEDVQNTSQNADAILVGTGILLEKTDELRVQKIQELLVS